MNRAQRRAEKHGKKQYEVIVNLPPMLDEWTIFDCPDRIMQKIKNGAIESHQGRPIFVDNEGEWCDVCAALSGWIFTWQKIVEKLQSSISLQGLQTIHNKLNVAMPITNQDLIKAEECLNLLRKLFRTSNRQVIKEVAKTAQIAIYLEGQRKVKNES